MRLISRTVIYSIAGCMFCAGVGYAKTDPLTDYFERRYGVKPDTGILQLQQQEKEADRQAAIMVKSARDLSPEEVKELRHQAKEEIAEALRQRDQKLAEFGPDIGDEQKKQVEKEYHRELARIDLNLKYSRLSIGLPEDSTSLFTAKSIEIHGNTLLKDQDILNPQKLPIIFDEIYDFKVLHELIIKPASASEAGYKVSQKTIQGFTRYILSLYEKRGYRGIYVYVSAESLVEGTTKLKDDILRIDVLEAAISDINVSFKTFDAAMDRDPNVKVPYRELQENEKPRLNPFFVQSWSPVQSGGVIKIKELEDYTNLLNLNPDRYVSAAVSKSDDPDRLNLDYSVYENSPWHFYAQSDNSGTKETRWNPRIGLINTNLLGMDDRLSLVYWGPLQDKPLEPFDENWSVFGNYDFPIFTPRLRLNLYGGYSDYERFTSAAGGITFLGKGSFYGAQLRFNLFQMTLFQEDRWFFDVIGGVRHENSKSSYLSTKYDIDVDLWNAGAELYGYWDTKRLSSSSFTFNRSQSMSASSRSEFQKARLGTDPDFMVYTLSASHSQYSKDRLHRLLGRFVYINSDGRLIPANMTSFGGLYTVRGYKEYEVVADGGIQWSLQYEYDLVKHPELQEAGKIGPFSKLALLAFTDHGRAVNKDPVAGEPRVVEMASYGAGLNATIAKSLDMGVYYGVPLRSTEETNSGKGRWNFAFMLRF